MKDRLVIERNQDQTYTIDWYIPDECEMGGRLGQDKNDGRGEPPKDREDYEHWLASKVAAQSTGVRRNRYGFFWDSRREVDAAMRQIKEALRQDRPLPEWAKKALAEGWKPPKGWRA